MKKAQSDQAKYIKYIHLGTKSYKGTRVKILEENAKTFSQKHWQQKIKVAQHGTNHKSLQIFMEINPKSLQKQHGHKHTKHSILKKKKKTSQIYKSKPKYHSQTKPRVYKDNRKL